MTVQQASQQLLFQLFHIYEEREAKNVADLVMERITEWKRIHRVLNKEVPLSAVQEQLLAKYITELSNHRPVQYVLNEAWFYGMKLFVDENVLIPRPETEELIEWVLQDIRTLKQLLTDIEIPVQLLDVGTGSGCIALALKKKLPSAELYACDVSEEALAVAKKNSDSLGLAVNFIQCDFLKKEAADSLPKVHYIISNPPYIPVQDKTTMFSNVLQYEPHLALFVPDHDPLIFYKSLVDFAKTHLHQHGSLFVEIHEDMSNKVMDLFSQQGFENVELKKDMQGKDRMVKAGSLLIKDL